MTNTNLISWSIIIISSISSWKKIRTHIQFNTIEIIMIIWKIIFKVDGWSKSIQYIIWIHIYIYIYEAYMILSNISYRIFSIILINLIDFVFWKAIQQNSIVYYTNHTFMNRISRLFSNMISEVVYAF